MFSRCFFSVMKHVIRVCLCLVSGFCHETHNKVFFVVVCLVYGFCHETHNKGVCFFAYILA